jgi:uncharacterized glyoxalase superfamily protein PhnB
MDCIPFLHHHDPTAAIDWLTDVFGFERTAAFRDPGGVIVHAELRHGDGIVMVGSSGKNDLGMKTPHELGGVNQGIGVYIDRDGVDAHCERARAGGAVILREPYDTSFGARAYVARDPEGHLWSFGSYRPRG